MQVGFSFPSESSMSLQNKNAYIRASYVFVIFSMVSVVVILAFVFFIFLWIFVFNMVKAITHAGSEQKKRRELAEQRQREKENGGES